MILLRSLLALFLLLAVPIREAVAQSVPVPPLTGPVIDQVGALSPAVREQLKQEVWALKNEKGSEIAVLIVTSTKPEEIEQFSFRVADTWKLGRKGIDDGVLLLVAVNDRRVRIEVGRGLEGDIPDVKAFRIIDNLIVPHFKQGDIPGGVQAGVKALDGLIRGVDLPAPTAHMVDRKNLSFSLVATGCLIGLLLAWFLVPFAGATIGAFTTDISARDYFSVEWSALLGILVWLLVFVIASIFRRVGGAYGIPSYRGVMRGSSSNSSCGGGSFGGGGSFSGGGASGRW